MEPHKLVSENTMTMTVKSTVLSVRLSIEDRDAFMQLCAQESTCASTVVREVILKALSEGRLPQREHAANEFGTVPAADASEGTPAGGGS